MDIMWHEGIGADDALRTHALRSNPPRSLRSLPTNPPRSLRSLRSKRLEGSRDQTLVGRHCPACGSDAHGRPWVRLPDGSSPHVSLSRCGDHVVTAFADHPVGIDVESIAAVDARWDPALILHPTETPPNLPRQIPILPNLPRQIPVFRNLPRQIREDGSGSRRVTVAEERAALWCRKEAILKALGTGLRTPMSEIRVADWPVEDIAAPQGLTAAVVVITQGRAGSSTA